jgi:hypothetical protein
MGEVFDIKMVEVKQVRLMRYVKRLERGKYASFDLTIA